MIPFVEDAVVDTIMKHYPLLGLVICRRVIRARSIIEDAP